MVCHDGPVFYNTVYFYSQQFLQYANPEGPEPRPIAYVFYDPGRVANEKKADRIYTYSQIIHRTQELV